MDGNQGPFVKIKKRFVCFLKMRMSLKAVHPTPSFVLNYVNTSTAAGSGFTGSSKHVKMMISHPPSAAAVLMLDISSEIVVTLLSKNGLAS